MKLGGVISANTGLDPANASSDLLKQAIEILQDPNTTFRFDGSDLMPGAVGADSFWKGMVDWLSGEDTQTGRRHHRVELADELAPASIRVGPTARRAAPGRYAPQLSDHPLSRP